MTAFRSGASAAWRRIVGLGFRLLYNELAWLYDPVSWAVSRGHWRQWQRTALPYLPPAGRVLEVGFGPGHLLADLAAAGYQPIGLDPSPAMLRLAQRRLRRGGFSVPLCRGRAGTLPFAPLAVEAIVATFPTAYVYDLGWMEQVVRILKPGGRLVVVEMATLSTSAPLVRDLEWLYRLTGQRGQEPDLPHMLNGAGLKARRERVLVNGSNVRLTIAEKH
jgi:ubiquinone/menaquinone biosynthesis C-methylase UbiE